MKKTLVALSVLAAAANVNAAEIYSTDASKVSLKGEVDAYLATTDIDNGTTKTKKDPYVAVWGKIQLDAEHKVSDTLTSFASFEIESGTDVYDGTNTSNASFDDVYVGVKTDTWGVAVGEVGDLADSQDAIEKGDITNEGKFFGTAGGHRAESAGQGVVFKASLTDGLVFVADINTESDENIDNTYGTSLDWAINDIFSVGASYTGGEQAENIDYSVSGISASAEVSGFYFAATFAQFEGVNSWGLFSKTTNYFDGDAYGVAASYTINKTRIYTTYDVMELDEQQVAGSNNVNAKGDLNNLVVGVDYALQDNVTIFGEYQAAETSNDFSAGANQDADTFILGAYYTF
ncbi:porin [Vibrio coralliilyticus]|uniref:Porin n=1 Tax=Vibrio coralliilyticus TaxID=190893 RepID=A0AAN0SEI3_9VIBR|nr:porin [Vibrio coralliilyticus]AIW19303.1 porin [Vibrio coralliilyticus]ARC92586.1 porin [Vibrio coralliilyticus]NOH40314.1 porin [Vibrio coralliilyticus]